MQNSKLNVSIIDGYLDEPSCLGVPPYISPHLRYLWGALLEAGITPERLNYISIDSLRQDKENYLKQLEAEDIVIMIAGTTVPGHYLGGQPASAAEIKEISQKLFYPTKVLGGPITLIPKMRAKFKADFDIISSEVAAFDIYQRLLKKEIPLNMIAEKINSWAIKGADL
ncbi:MAG: radical SAM protein, partial [Halanaerobium sp. MSAO_Bac5]